jgi:hypothetical protein
VRRRKVTYPPPKTATSGGSAGPTNADLRAAAAASRTVTINLDAMKGRELHQGSRVQITSGIYAGEFAIVESLVSGVIPAAVVRTEAGKTRRARTVDLVPAPKAAVEREAVVPEPAGADEADPPN